MLIHFSLAIGEYLGYLFSVGHITVGRGNSARNRYADLLLANMAQEDYDPKYREWKEKQERKKRLVATFTPAQRKAWIAKKRTEENRQSNTRKIAKRSTLPAAKRDKKLYYRHQLPNNQASPRKRDESSGE